jgi:hypothetical protein
MTIQEEIAINRNKFLEERDRQHVEHAQMQDEKIRGLQDMVKELLKGKQ